MSKPDNADVPGHHLTEQQVVHWLEKKSHEADKVLSMTSTKEMVELVTVEYGVRGKDDEMHVEDAYVHIFNAKRIDVWWLARYSRHEI